MKSLAAAIALAVAAPAFAADSAHPFDVHDLVMMDRVSDPALSPDGKLVAFQVRETDYDANKGSNGIWMVPAGGGKTVRLTDKALNATSRAGRPTAACISSRRRMASASSGTSVRTAARRRLRRRCRWTSTTSSSRRTASACCCRWTCSPIAPISPAPRSGSTTRKADKATGVVYDKIFIRHWDTWADGRRSQLFIADVGADGKIGAPRLLSKGIDGDVPSKPFGDDTEYAFSPDGATVYFDARIAGKTEPWSTNFDIFSVPADGSAAPKNLTADNPAWDGYPLPSANGKTLYYLAMKRAGLRSGSLRHLGDRSCQRQQARDRRRRGIARHRR